MDRPHRMLTESIWQGGRHRPKKTSSRRKNNEGVEGGKKTLRYMVGTGFAVLCDIASNVTKNYSAAPRDDFTRLRPAKQSHRKSPS
ncbi:hypothetical protein BDW22DRAFT_1356685, partial [Trametopsis cervina]